MAEQETADREAAPNPGAVSPEATPAASATSPASQGGERQGEADQECSPSRGKATSAEAGHLQPGGVQR